MSTEVILASSVIVQALSIAGIVGEQFETPTNTQSAQGLRSLNELLGEFYADGVFLPYPSEVSVDLLDGQETYFVDNLYQVESISYTREGVRYPLRSLTRKQYFNPQRVNDIRSLPTTYFAERQLGGIKLFIYYLPNGNYPLLITGRFQLTDVDFSTDLRLTFDSFYITFLQYLLAQKLAELYSLDLRAVTKRKIAELERRVGDLSPSDVGMRPNGLLVGGDTPSSWMQVNFAPGSGLP